MEARCWRHKVSTTDWQYAGPLEWKHDMEAWQVHFDIFPNTPINSSDGERPRVITPDNVLRRSVNGCEQNFRNSTVMAHVGLQQHT